MNKKSIIWHGAGKMAIFMRLWWSTSNYRVTFSACIFFSILMVMLMTMLTPFRKKKTFACKSKMAMCIVHDARAMFHSVIYQPREKRKMRATTCQMAASNWQYLKSLAAKNGQASDNAFGMCTLASQSAPHFWTDICNQNVWDKIARIVQTKNFKIFKTLFISFASS